MSLVYAKKSDEIGRDVVDRASTTRVTTPAVLLGREGGGGRRSADAVLPGQESIGVRLQKGSDN